MFTVITNHVQQAIARLLTQYQTAINLQGLLTAFVNEIQTVENVLNDMNNLRYLSGAFGLQLDNIGQIVGVTRPLGASDTVYLALILGQIKINTSQGQPEQAIQAFELFTGVSPIRLFEVFPAEVIIDSTYLPAGQADANNIFNLMGEVLPAGVRLSEIVAIDPVMPFTYAGVLSPGSGYNTGVYPTMFRPKYPFAYAGTNPDTMGYGTKLDPLVGGVYAS